MDHDTKLELNNLNAVLTNLELAIEDDCNIADENFYKAQDLIHRFQADLLKILTTED